MQIMLDLETMGTKPGSVIRSIGAIAFYLNGTLTPYEKFYSNIDRDSCLDAGLTEDQSTMDFWHKQPAETQAIFEQNPRPLPEVLSDFYSWFLANDGVEVWAQGAAFDPVLTEHAMNVCGIKVPWKFWNVRDTRTIYQVAGFDHHAATRAGVEHYALDDCLHQIKCVQQALRSMGK